MCACVCVCLELTCRDGSLSSIKEMFGLINHDAAHSLCGRRSVTCPGQLLFTFAAAPRNFALGLISFRTPKFALGPKCMAVNPLRVLRQHAQQGTRAACIIIYGQDFRLTFPRISSHVEEQGRGRGGTRLR